MVRINPTRSLASYCADDRRHLKRCHANRYPIDIDASALSVILSALQTMPALWVWAVDDVALPRRYREAYWPRRSGPTRSPILIAPMLLDLTMTSVNESTP